MSTYSYQTTSGTTATTTDQSNAPGIDPHSGFQVVTPTTVSSATTAPTATTTYTQPNYPTSPDISTLSTDYTPLTATPQETQASNLTKELADINTSLSGKSAYQTQQNAAAGVDQITQAINDNNTAVKQLQNDSNTAKLNQENRLAPTFAISGEQGAIDRATAVKALTLSSISDVLQNNLVAAQAKADRAVAAQYGPLEAELKAKTANLQLILNDPATSLADKNRATQQQLVLNKQTADIAKAKDDTTNVLKIMQDAGQNSATFKATANYPTLSMALNAIAHATTPAQAIQIQAETGLEKGTQPKILGSAKTGYFSYDAATGQTTPLGGGGNSPTPGGISKGKLSDNGFVNKVLSASGVAYQDAVNQVPEGRIGVIDNKTGAVGSILPGEFDSAKYTKL